MEIEIILRKVESGEEVSFVEDHVSELSALWMWQDGNYSCDCNRELFFERAKGKDPDLDEVWCSEGRFEVVSLEPTDR